MSNYQYQFVRQDIPVATQIIQMAHAVDRMSLRLKYEDDVARSVLIGVPNEEALMDVYTYLRLIGFDPVKDFHMFFDSEYPRGFNALATRPMNEEERIFFSQYKTYKVENNTF